ncbi:MAG: right-handed parallel beta-helix repeat-containing protein [Phycisphaerales bacterium]|jgi:hypothetical protein|nr:right-handed parallel beta-helix repeat-containing protein [Phycisphaerales bacterium]
MLARLSSFVVAAVVGCLASVAPCQPALGPASEAAAPPARFEAAPDGAMLIVPPIEPMVQPIRIEASGLYRLAGNIVMAGDASALLIERANVTLDLNGYVIVGTRGAAPGISVVGVRSAITIRNGIVRNFGDGIVLVDALSARADGLIIETNVRHGIFSSRSVIAEDCILRGNGGWGMLLGPSSRASRCTATANTVGGISTGTDSIIERCIASGNAGPGIDALSTALVLDSVASGNGANGVLVRANAVVSHVVTRGNQSNNIEAHEGSVVAFSGAAEGSLQGIAMLRGVVFASSASNNQTYGIGLEHSCGELLAAFQNQVGVYSSIYASVDGMVATQNTIGLQTSGPASGVRAWLNTTGIDVDSSAVVTNSVSRLNNFSNYFPSGGKFGSILAESSGAFTTTNAAFNH